MWRWNLPRMNLGADVEAPITRRPRNVMCCVFVPFFWRDQWESPYHFLVSRNWIRLRVILITLRMRITLRVILITSFNMIMRKKRKSKVNSGSLLLSVLWWHCPANVRAQTLNVWYEISVPPVIPYSLPLCDEDCTAKDMKGAICPRVASTIIALRGRLPTQDACLQQEDGWRPNKRPSAMDTDGCGPCLLTKEYETCHDISNPLRHRGV